MYIVSNIDGSRMCSVPNSVSTSKVVEEDIPKYFHNTILALKMFLLRVQIQRTIQHNHRRIEAMKKCQHKTNQFHLISS